MHSHQTFSALETGLDHIRSAPADQGTLEMIIIRPSANQRVTPERCSFSAKGGAEGDHWALGCWKSLPDGSPDPTVQVAIMSSRCLSLLAPRSDWPLAGDNLIVDLDLSIHNLQPGHKLQIGTVVLEITSVPHTGCAKFKDRFGEDGLKFISNKTGKELRLRGIYAKIITDGELRLGDHVVKLDE